MKRIALALLLAACGGSSAQSHTATQLLVQAPANAALTVPVGGTLQLSAVALDANGNSVATPAGITWTSDNSAVATVNANGLVTGVASGVANITATASSTLKGSGQVTVGAGATVIPWSQASTNITNTIAAGSSVSWRGADGVSHTVTPDTAPPPNAVNVFPGANSSPQTISTPGTYHYHCSIHPTMHGTLIVQ